MKIIRGLKDIKFKKSCDQFYYFEAWKKNTNMIYGWFQYKDNMYEVHYACTMEDDKGIIENGDLVFIHIRARQLYPLSPPNIRKVKEFIKIKD